MRLDASRAYIIAAICHRRRWRAQQSAPEAAVRRRYQPPLAPLSPPNDAVKPSTVYRQKMSKDVSSAAVHQNLNGSYGLHCLAPVRSTVAESDLRTLSRMMYRKRLTFR